jgi:hypothetical protein
MQAFILKSNGHNCHLVSFKIFIFITAANPCLEVRSYGNAILLNPLNSHTKMLRYYYYYYATVVLYSEAFLYEDGCLLVCCAV